MVTIEAISKNRKMVVQIQHFLGNGILKKDKQGDLEGGMIEFKVPKELDANKTDEIVSKVLQKVIDSKSDLDSEILISKQYDFSDGHWINIELAHCDFSNISDEKNIKLLLGIAKKTEKLNNEIIEEFKKETLIKLKK